jgi:Flp pilus assembly protein TadB
VRRFVVLSDHEQQALREVQRHLMAEDPDFARSFDEAGRQDSTYSVQWVYAMPRWVYATAVVVAVALGVLMLVVSGPGTALIVAVLATTIFVIQRRRGTPGRREA